MEKVLQSLPPAPDRSDRARQILSAAKRVFAASNFQLSTTADLAAAAGVSEPLIYRHFSSKKELFLAVLDDAARSIFHRWEAIRASEPGSLDCLRRIGQDYLRLLERDNEDLKVFFKAVSEEGDPDIRGFLADSYQRYARYLEGVIRRGQETGEIIADVPARSLAWEMLSLGAAFNLLTVLDLAEWRRADREAQFLGFLERIANHGQPRHRQTPPTSWK